MRRVANATQRSLISSQRRASRSREPGENCIDNITIAWMAALNLPPLYDMLAQRKATRPSPAAKRPAKLALYRVEYICYADNEGSFYYEIFLPLLSYRASYGLNKLLRIHALC